MLPLVMVVQSKSQRQFGGGRHTRDEHSLINWHSQTGIEQSSVTCGQRHGHCGQKNAVPMCP